ncbi:hypothetical protein [Paraliomyxa miuraensis]|uniref:hypothetical protein n=1 Tax=Paraliomyxa miuraensis TaxID=376150 RepID=UPI00224FF15E|nr:hypothetical protein [Paraliomyxa miuraensis]MCX4240674.1 hypothetical protein [Paraliomyxa miuraensis]
MLVELTLAKLGVGESSSLQRVAAQFRRADLLDAILQSIRERLAQRAPDSRA